jgi:hypothetical protein
VCRSAENSKAGVMSTRSVGRGMQGTLRLRWQSDGPGPGQCMNS